MNQSNPDTSSAAAADRCETTVIATPSEIAARMLQVYTARNILLGADLFHAPAWEILLLLESAGGGLGASELGQLMNVPPPALQRWIDVLRSRDLIALAGNGAEEEVYVLTGDARADLKEVLLAALRKPPAGS